MPEAEDHPFSERRAIAPRSPGFWAGSYAFPQEVAEAPGAEHHSDTPREEEDLFGSDTPEAEDGLASSDMLQEKDDLFNSVKQ